MLCCKLHCQKGVDLILFSYKIPKTGTRNPKRARPSRFRAAFGGLLYAPQIRKRGPETGNQKSETWNQKPETWNPKPETWNPKPETWNPKLETWNPNPQTISGDLPVSLML